MLIAFSNNKKDFHSKIIRYFTNGNWSHCFPIVGQVGSLQIGLSADELSVNLVPISKYYKIEDYDLEIYQVPILETGYRSERVVKMYHHKIYGYPDLLFFVYRWACMKLGWKFKRENLLDVGIFCSELTVLTLIEMGYHEAFKKYPANTVHPHELREIVKNLPRVVKIY